MNKPERPGASESKSAESSGSGQSSASGQAPSESPGGSAANVAGAGNHVVTLATDELPPDPLGIDDEAGLDPTLSIADRLRTVVIGKKHDLADHSIYQHLALAAFLAWVGLGADGLSSSCYGPSEAFKMLSEQGDYRFLAVFLALATALTVLIISACYSHIIEEFPGGGGGYLVASKLLGKHVGMVSGCALLVDYALTITVSIAAAGDALFGLLKAGAPLAALGSEAVFASKLWFEIGLIVLLIVLNLRGVKESVMALMPIFLLFLVTHAIMIAGSVTLRGSAIGEVAHEVSQGLSDNLAKPGVGLIGLLMIFFHAYSMGAGTYTGLEAVSNSMAVMKEPRVATGKRTMVYMALSLALTAGGLIIAYLLLNLKWSEEPTMNQILCERFVSDLGLPHGVGVAFLLMTIISEGCLLLVAAQAGFIDGPRVLANMARDSWLPHWFSSLSERLAMHNGIMLMGTSALAALWVTGGNVGTLVIMYSINVFVTFSLSMIGMLRHWYGLRGEHPLWRRRSALFLLGATMCVSILAVTVYEKFDEGGWKTVFATSMCCGLCLLMHRYYAGISRKLSPLASLTETPAPPGQPVAGEPDPHAPTAIVLVGGFSGLGIHTLLGALRFGPGRFSNVVFISAGVVDSGNFKGADGVEELRQHTEEALNKYVDYARRIGIPAVGYMTIGSDAVDELERLCVEVRQKFPRSVVFAGQLVFQRDTWYRRLMHNGTAFSLQRRLQWDNVPMVILPTRVR
jgi:amino acid transporter